MFKLFSIPKQNKIDRDQEFFFTIRNINAGNHRIHIFCLMYIEKFPYR